MSGELATYDDPECLTEYNVAIEHAGSYGWFYVRVFYGDNLIAQKALMKNHTRAAKWAAKQIRQHIEARRLIGGLKW